MPTQLKKGDTLPTISATLTGDDGTALDLSGSTVEFRFRHVDGGTPTTGSATVVNAADGKVKYDWSAGDTDDAGYYIGEWIVTTGSEVLTAPGDSYVTFEIVETVD